MSAVDTVAASAPVAEPQEIKNTLSSPKADDPVPQNGKPNEAIESSAGNVDVASADQPNFTPATEGAAKPSSVPAPVDLEAAAGAPAAPVTTSIYVAHGMHRDEAMAARAKKREERKKPVREQAEAHKNAGDLLVEAKKIKAALPQYQEAIRLWPSNPAYHIAVATAFRKLGWYEEAAHSSTVALTLEPKSTEARYLRGVSRLEQRMLKPAKIDFEVVLETDPNHFLAHATLAQVNSFLSAMPDVDESSSGNLAVLDFSFPPLDYENLEIMSVSDSDESNHVGNGVPCRFYNQLGCAKGKACDYSHAPDERSVRDRLGRNVCIYYLLDACKFGTAKCVYSHRRDALPTEGPRCWWADPARVAKVKATVDAVEQKKKDLRALEQERIKVQYRTVKAAAHANKANKDSAKTPTNTTTFGGARRGGARHKAAPHSAKPKSPSSVKPIEAAEAASPSATAKAEKAQDSEGTANSDDVVFKVYNEDTGTTI